VVQCGVVAVVGVKGERERKRKERSEAFRCASVQEIIV